MLTLYDEAIKVKMEVTVRDSRIGNEIPYEKCDVTNSVEVSKGMIIYFKVFSSYLIIAFQVCSSKKMLILKHYRKYVIVSDHEWRNFRFICNLYIWLLGGLDKIELKNEKGFSLNFFK